MNVLIACEESQEVCKAFRELGHNAFSCDLQDCSGGHPEWHIHGDCKQVMNGKCLFVTQAGTVEVIPDRWDLIIAHPPCTYLTNAGAVRMFRNEKKQYGSYGTFQMVNVERLKHGIQARDFFTDFIHVDCDHVAIENPVPMTIYQLPTPTQVIQPYEYGEPFSKKTCLWLKGLKPLEPTKILTEYSPFINGGVDGLKEAITRVNALLKVEHEAKPSQGSQRLWHHNGLNTF